MEEVKAYFEALERGTMYVDNVTANFHPVMNGEVYLTGEDVCRILHITTRTLQDYRAQRIIPFISLPGKTLYRQSDLLRIRTARGCELSSPIAHKHLKSADAPQSMVCRQSNERFQLRLLSI